MPPNSLLEWMVGQNISSHKKSNKLRHVVSFEVLTDDESGSDLYKIAVPRGKLAQPSNGKAASEPIKSALKQPSKTLPDSETEVSSDVSEETSGYEETSDEEPDPTCPCTKCIEGRKRLKQMTQAKVKVKGKPKVAIATAVSSEEESEDDGAAAVHAKHQAKKTKKKVSFANNTALKKSESDSSSVKAKTDKKTLVSSRDESDSEASVVEANIKVKNGKKGTLSMAMAISSSDESESEASVVQTDAKGKKRKQATSLVTSESSAGEGDSDAPPAPAKQPAKNKKANSGKKKDTEDRAKQSRSAKKDTAKAKKKKKAESESDPDSSDSSTEEPPSDAEEDTEKDTKAQSAKKGKQKGKATDKKVKAGGGTKEKQQKAESKKGDKKKTDQQTKSKKRSDKSASESESESVSETEPESEVEVKKVRFKNSNRKATYPPAHPAPDMRQPNLLLPPRTSVMQVEHAVEVPQDPRPNAFYDNDSGTMRVYHGPTYGNPSGMLYPKRVYSYQNLPVGVPHPMQNPWYNGFPNINGQPAPPHVPPQVGATDESNPWFRGYGTVGPVPIPPHIPPPPDFITGKDNKPQPYYDARRNLSPPRDRDAGWDSNVIPIPSVEVTAPAGSPTKDSRAGSASGDAWGAQGASGSKKNPDERRKKKKDPGSLDAALNDRLAGIGKALQEAAAKDSADLRAREERWSNRSGSSKEASPQPNNGWNNNANSPTNNNNGGGSGWDGWDSGNAKTGGDSTWDNGTTGNNNNDWGNSGGDTGWDNANTNNNANDYNNNNGGWSNNNNNNGGWDTNNNNNTNNNDSGWGNNDNNGGPSNTANDNNGWGNTQTNNDNSWAPAGPPSSPLPQNATPIPGTWASPIPSESGGGRGKGNANTWGDETLAQSSGGYWDTKEGQADMAKGTNKGDKSWW